MAMVRMCVMTLIGLLAVGLPGQAMADERPSADMEKRIRELEKKVEELMRLLGAEPKREEEEKDEALAKLTERVKELEETEPSALIDLGGKLDLGGYGEMHANFGEADSADQFDLHRLVFYIGYDFNDWIKFHSEIEIEHAFVSDGDGELSIEQAFVDFLLSDHFNIRAGRILTPMGIINMKHEPPTFNGVERPSFSKYIIPTTWSSDGIGAFGNITPSLKYQAYIVGGLDGSKFTSKDGIRKGRIKERPSLNDPAVTGRLDYYPFAARQVGAGQTLRLGVSGYAGRLDNADEGKKSGADGHIRMYSGDFEYSISRFDLRGVIAHARIDEAEEIGAGTASEIFGWYLEGGYHFLPDSWKRGKLEKADAVAFVRYDDFDTQYDMPSGMTADPAGDRDEWTFGVNFHLTPNFVVKADYKIRDDATSSDLNDLFNLGLGWQF